MNRKTKKRIALPLAIFTLVIIVALVAIFSIGSGRPLSQAERALVGSWSHVPMPGEEPPDALVFESNRTFRSENGEFTGRWWISSGQLHLRMWRGDEPTVLPFADAVVRPITDWWNSASADVSVLQVTIKEDGKHIELADSENTPETLFRVR
ncbi:MAG: hypothetical protein ACR2NP_07995 [Pirellulaceae bacterium]